MNVLYARELARIHKAWDSLRSSVSKLIVTAAFIHIVRAFVIQFMRPLSL